MEDDETGNDDKDAVDGLVGEVILYAVMVFELLLSSSTFSSSNFSNLD